MKTKLLIIALLICSISQAQDKRFTLSLYTELPDANTHNEKYDYGVNIGIQIEYQMTINYFDVEVYTFPDLNGVPYTHLKSTLLGFNHHSRFEDVRAYIGLVQTGFIFRNDYIYPMAGSEIGIEYYFNDFYIGIESSVAFCTDDKYFDPRAEGFWRYNAGIRIGIEL